MIKILRVERILFRGDIYHNGKNNRRLSFKIVPMGAVMEEVELDSVATLFKCPGCNKEMKEISYQNHKRYYCGRYGNKWSNPDRNRPKGVGFKDGLTVTQK